MRSEISPTAPIRQARPDGGADGCSPRSIHLTALHRLTTGGGRDQAPLLDAGCGTAGSLPCSLRLSTAHHRGDSEHLLRGGRSEKRASGLCRVGPMRCRLAMLRRRDLSADVLCHRDVDERRLAQFIACLWEAGCW